MESHGGHFFVACVHAAAVHFQGNAKQCPWGIGIAQGRTSSKYQGVYQDVYKGNTLILRYPNSRELGTYPKIVLPLMPWETTLCKHLLWWGYNSCLLASWTIFLLSLSLLVLWWLLPFSARMSLPSAQVAMCPLAIRSPKDERPSILWLLHQWSWPGSPCTQAGIVGCCGIIGRRPCFQEIILNTMLLATPHCWRATLSIPRGSAPKPPP